MPRSKGMPRELRMLSPDLPSIADRDARHRTGQAKSTNASDTNSVRTGSSTVTRSTITTADTPPISSFDEIFYDSSESEEESSYGSDDESESEEEESDEPSNGEGDSGQDNDNNSHDDNNNNNTNDEALPPFVTPPPPVGKGKHSFEAETPQNVLSPLDVLQHTFEKEMTCPNNDCYSKNEETFIRNPLKMEHCQYGFASEVYIKCPCCGWATAVCPPKSQEKGEPAGGTPTKDKRDTDSEQFHLHSLNYNAALIAQKLGFGMTGLAMIMAFFGLSNSFGSSWKWNRLFDRLGLALNLVAEEVFIENQTKEKKAMEEKAQDLLVEWLQSDEGIEATAEEDTAEEATENKRQQLLNMKDGKVGIAATNDTGWQKRRIGFSGGNSRTGHNCVCGGLTCLPIGVRSFSQHCRTCEVAEKLEIVPRPHRCPRNFDLNMSSKAMEPLGAVQQCVAVWDSSVGIWVHTYISDDDSTTRANLQHSHHDIIAALHPEIAVDGKIPSHLKRRYGWPVNAKNQLLKDYGKVPYNVAPPERFLADLQHRIRCFAKAIYELRCKGNPKTKPVDKLLKEECANIKKSFGAHCKKNQHWSAERFCTEVECTWRHTFDDHSLCDAYWCTYLQAEKEEDEEKKKTIDDRKKYRSTDTPQEMKLKKRVGSKVAGIITKEKMLEIYHCYNAQKNEALQKQATVSAPKDKFFGGKMQIHDRLRLVAIIDSLGEYEGLSRIYNALGIPPMHRVMGLWAAAKDKAGDRHKQHRKKIDTKRKRAAKQIEDMKAGCRKEKRAKKEGMTHATGIANTIPAAAAASKKQVDSSWLPDSDDDDSVDGCESPEI